jgi:putative mRNA 3-end processing factor
VLGSAQIVMDYRGERIVVSGDYKRRADPTCPPFVPVPCDVFVTEATFGLPVFRHPDTGSEIDRLLHRLHSDPERCVLVGAYALGKAQRIICELRERGHDDPIYVHGALERLCNLYEELGVPLGELRPATGASKDELKGRIVLAPPGALNDRWSRRLPDPVTAMASVCASTAAKPAPTRACGTKISSSARFPARSSSALTDTLQRPHDRRHARHPRRRGRLPHGTAQGPAAHRR